MDYSAILTALQKNVEKPQTVKQILNIKSFSNTHQMCTLCMWQNKNIIWPKSWFPAEDN